jgi:tetratricopeptide (TPR) repeat protein
MKYLSSIPAGWQIPELPGAPRRDWQEADLKAVKTLLWSQLSGDAGSVGRMQTAAADWLYDLVRGNVRRGRVFELDEVLATQRADCLGYARLLAVLGRGIGLEMGVVEVLIDNAGRYVPHHVCLVNFAGGSHRLLDAWYGSRDIHHRRLGALVNSTPADIDTAELGGVRDLRGLPETCLEGITRYIKGNRCLERGEINEAIEHYSAAVQLYPNNSRAYYNRAIAYERAGEAGAARSDYARALRDESSLIRVLASTAELDDLMLLDEKGISEGEQEIYLWYRGFRTGTAAGYQKIARQAGISPSEVKKIIDRVAGLCFS